MALVPFFIGSWGMTWFCIFWLINRGLLEETVAMEAVGVVLDSSIIFIISNDRLESVERKEFI